MQAFASQTFKLLQVSKELAMAAQGILRHQPSHLGKGHIALEAWSALALKHLTAEGAGTTACNMDACL